KCKAPTVLSQPQGGSRYWSGSITFTSSVAGAFPLNYQWRKEGVALPGATNLSLVLTNLQLTSSGNYALVASNVYGATTSSFAPLSVKLAELWISKSNGQVALT